MLYNLHLHYVIYLCLPFTTMSPPHVSLCLLHHYSVIRTKTNRYTYNMIEKIDVRLLGWAKTNQSCWIDLFLFFTHFCVEFSTFDKVTFSDEVRMSSLIASVTMWHSAFKSHAPTELADWCFMLHNTQNWSRLSLSIHIVNYHHLPSLFSEASTELIRGHPVIHRAIPPWSCGIFACWLWGWIF